MILVIDNNDSFTYNIVELLRNITKENVSVIRINELDINCINKYEHIILSPGPGVPNDYPLMFEILERYDDTKSILGICLGHQTICQYYGGELANMKKVLHGVKSKIECDNNSLLFNGIKSMEVGRYHSWYVKSLPKNLIATAFDEHGILMGVEHKNKKVYGIQFHPESYITQKGGLILHNFIYGISK
ncbi:MAG: aminodeoxychorismate/anthranilate synthase component II [Bacteroidales bacterium]|jgi:anthranilate synthase/aminodeoxychorismate synthase-like glutamine amidotransferase|nr:aminodeoxychorismate/anthranilate synthase component II [Bacteroidales bacterium]